MKAICKRGHLLSGDNLYIAPKTGARGCRACRRLQQIEFFQNRIKNSERFGNNRELAIKRDGEKCVSCGLTRLAHQTKYGADITVDHIDGLGRYTEVTKRNNSLSNLQTLCLSCHGRKDKLRGLGVKK